jgi:hypothetical protein
MASDPLQRNGRVLRLLVAVVGQHCAETVVLVVLDLLGVCSTAPRVVSLAKRSLR